ncbi:uncharacterized protein LOC133036250 [Cannabis sativa]|uniref:uncharacterized protein LOC133036250 n=1 Tax=Cannabis sativa TaxID=3483 RepID=UPI0029CA2B23|nr:uncharacterized protein LOC133036250 [Cannabis sativa]
MAALNRFILKSTDKCVPFFNILRGNKKFEWTKECKESFQNIKRHIATPPVLAKPITRETLFVYLAISEDAISAAIVREEGKYQQPIYYVSKRLLGAESRLIKWSIELGQFDITYHPRTSIKGQALADFLIEGAGMILISPEGYKFHYALRFQFDASNNESEYEAFIDLKIVEALKVKNLISHSDLQLIVNQVFGEYHAKCLKMAKYLEKVRKNLERFDYFKIEKILREQNSNTDALAKLSSQNGLDELNPILVEMLSQPSICETEDVEMIDSSPTWMTLIVNYLLNGQLPNDKNEARKLLYTAPHYTVIEGKLYRRGCSMPLFRCVLPTEAIEIIRKIHEGFCEDRVG